MYALSWLTIPSVVPAPTSLPYLGDPVLKIELKLISPFLKDLKSELTIV